MQLTLQYKGAKETVADYHLMKHINSSLSLPIPGDSG